ncbi:alginate export family protein [Cognatiyoonia sp. IB215446]|uniref:alginate export family protein n=1 Tax=Cognatiyoonia sp. IB215446 TaxID=3097355 RepID=UPI002A0F0CA6|nr:alginate export family protein [Cognatiyoonia sp. IB215446]MDX8350240.1 alginate export family protein [Cognatiyoonia sp. IB215446]
MKANENFAARIPGTMAGVVVLFAATRALSQDRDLTLIYDQDGLKVRGHLQLGLNAVAENNLFWDLAATTSPESGFDPDAEWLEGYIKPGLSFERRLNSDAIFYGKLSAVASYTWGTDAFDTGDTGDTTLEEAYLALRNDLGTGFSYDISLGARELRLGSGMLIASGATSGFERGALKFGPRKAWEMAAIGRMTFDKTTGTFFYLDPNELPSTDGSNELAGFDLRTDTLEGGYVGATFVSVLNSNSPYPQIGGAPVIGAREGTNTLNFYAKTNPFSGNLENWNFTSDLAYQRNDDFNLDAYAGRVTAEYKFANMAWSSSVAIGYHTFSGDDPDTTTYERFDPLYYEGSPSAWATGSKSASTFINSNVNALSLALRIKPARRDTWTLRYAHIRANELNSPIQFGQATRLDSSGNVIAGVTDAHLADDVFLEYSRVINRSTFLTAGVSVSFPGAGIEDVVGGSADPWTGGFLNVVFNF